MVEKLLRTIAFAAAATAAVALGGPTVRADHVRPLTSEDIAHADAEAGKRLAVQCAQCHGAEGISTNPDAPHIAGQHAIYLAMALDSYLDGFRAGMPMSKIVDGWSEADLINVAVHFSRLEPFAEVAPMPAGESSFAAATEAPADPFAQAKEVTQACAACHGEDGNSEVPGMPSVAGQPGPYLEAALKAYREGKRAHEVMQAYTLSLSDPDIALVSAYYAASKPAHRNGPIEGDLAAGATVAAACASCHGIDGNSDNPSSPRLAGLEPEYLAAAIRAYKDGTRDHAMMADFVEALEDEVIENVAAFYGAQKARPPVQPKRLTTDELAERCNRCHSAEGDSTNPKIPILTGQSQTYLATALRVYHTGERTQSTMRAMSFPLDEAEFRNLAIYYARKRRK